MTQRYEDRFSKRYKDTSLCLYEKYSYEDVCRLLNWPKNPPAQNIGGYKYDETTKTLPVLSTITRLRMPLLMKTDSSRRKTLLPFQRQNAQLIQMTQNGFINNLLKMKRIRSICLLEKTKMTAKQKAFISWGR